MKNFIFIVMIAGLAVSACNEKSSMEDQRRFVKDEHRVAVLRENVSNHSVPVDTARAWVKNYERWLQANNAERVRQVLPDGKTAEIPNSRSVWFSIEQLEKLVNRIKAEDGDGIRFYFARYGDNMRSGVDSCTQKPYNYSNITTLLMVPTKRKDCMHQDYYNGTSGVTSMDIENKGEMCPPPADCTVRGATLIP